jgi:hypothetical protein
MAAEFKKEIELEIGHVLFIDIVGYSKLLNEEQKERLNQLTEIVLATTSVWEATDEQLVRLPTGDGMALSSAAAPGNRQGAHSKLPKRSESTPNFPCAWASTADR